MNHNDSQEQKILWAVHFLSQQLEHIARQNQKLEKLMSTISDAISEYAAKQQTYNDAISKAIDDIGQEIQNLNTQIAQLQNSAGQITPQDQATLDNLEQTGQTLQSKIQALDTLNPPSVPAPADSTAPADTSAAAPANG